MIQAYSLHLSSGLCECQYCGATTGSTRPEYNVCRAGTNSMTLSGKQSSKFYNLQQGEDVCRAGTNSMHFRGINLPNLSQSTTG